MCVCVCVCVCVCAVEALHLAHLMASHGYFFPIDDHMLTVKNDNTYYRFQVSLLSSKRNIYIEIAFFTIVSSWEIAKSIFTHMKNIWIR